MKKLKLRDFQYLAQIVVSAGARDRKTDPCLSFLKTKAFVSLTGASDQNGIIYLISVLQVSKLSP